MTTGVQHSRDKAVDAVDILNDLMNDLISGTSAYRYFENRYHAREITFNDLAGMHRLCLTSLILALDKIREFRKRYLRIVPQHLRPQLIAVVDTVIAKGIPAFRDHCIGHIWNGTTNQPVKSSEIMKRISTIFEGPSSEFLSWLHVKSRRDTVAGTLESIRDAIAEEYAISREEVLKR